MREYFGISNLNIKFELNKKSDENILYFNIFYLNPRKNIHFKILPDEINNIINLYLDEFIDIQTQILFTSDYPFYQPIWSLSKLSFNFKTNLLLNDIYKYIIDCHNSQYNHDWSPATDIEKDILDFIRKINIFEYIFDT
jgi:hypothetical protein